MKLEQIKAINICTAAVKVVFTLLFVNIVFKSASAQRNALSGGARNSPSNYKYALMIYPTGIRSERDLPVCPTWIEEEDTKEEVGPSFPPGGASSAYYAASGNEPPKLQQPQSTKNPSDSRKNDDLSKYLSACNIIHKRYFFPIMIERLCRCPDRTECPMEWSPAPQYKDLFSANEGKQGSKQSVSTTPSTKSSNSINPFTVMVSSRTQLKFCSEVVNILPTCEPPKKHKEHSTSDYPSMIKTIKKTFLAPELPGVSVNCYCPPMYRQWNFLSKKDPIEHVNGTTTEASYSYRCDKLPKCKAEQPCGTVRTDLHFSYYHCSCPRNHLCLPKVYPPESSDDVVENVEEALYSGQVAPAFCTLE